MARFKKLIRTTAKVEELLSFADQATKKYLGLRSRPEWVWRELTETDPYYMDTVLHCNGLVKAKNFMAHARFAGRLSRTGHYVRVFILSAGDEYWHEPHGEGSYDDYGQPLEPRTLWIQVKTQDGKLILTKRLRALD